MKKILLILAIMLFIQPCFASVPLTPFNMPSEQYNIRPELYSYDRTGEKFKLSMILKRKKALESLLSYVILQKEAPFVSGIDNSDEYSIRYDLDVLSNEIWSNFDIIDIDTDESKKIAINTILEYSRKKRQAKARSEELYLALKISRSGDTPNPIQGIDVESENSIRDSFYQADAIEELSSEYYYDWVKMYYYVTRRMCI